jgi:Cu+-exporting ATPase
MFAGTATLAGAPPVTDRAEAPARVACRHCATPCAPDPAGGEAFCCTGCRTVSALLREHGLDEFYRLDAAAGRRVAPAGRYDYLNDPEVRARLVDFSDGRVERLTFAVPGIHCVACVWLLEQLFRFRPGLGESRVDFTQREVAVSYDPAQAGPGDVAALLASLGYPPELRLSALDGRRGSAVPRRLWLQVGVAGFAFGNTMLFALAEYLGMDPLHAAAFRPVFGWLSLLLAAPVVAFSAEDYWRAAWRSLRDRRLAIEVPIAAGLAAIFLWSVAALIQGAPDTYFDSLSGLVFFLLCGRVFQRKTFDRLTFDRDYRDFFPLAACRVTGDGGEERVALSQLRVGDRLRLRHGELIPADARLTSGEALVDYSFVTGESEPVRRACGETLHAGGRQAGGLIEAELTRPPSQSYLTSLWNHDAFRKSRDETYDTLTNRYSVRFTWTILALAAGTGLFWAAMEPARALPAVVGILIVACPCALALAAPFTLGAAVRALGRAGIFLRNGGVIESLARIDTVVFDKTGTLTPASPRRVEFAGTDLSESERAAVLALAVQSSHPAARAVARHLRTDSLQARAEATGFREHAGRGVEGEVDGRPWRLGSRAWFESLGVPPPTVAPDRAAVHVACGSEWRGAFLITPELRPEVNQLMHRLAGTHSLALLSGDHAGDRARFAPLFGGAEALHFEQSPHDKLGFIQARQDAGARVMMVGDGLNDAGALRQSDVGVAVVEEIGAFSPASDVILAAGDVPRLADLLAFARGAVRVVRLSFLLSAIYNIAGLSFAATGRLSPVICAVLMPLSTVTVVAFAVGAVRWTAARHGLRPRPESSSIPAQQPATEGERP